MRAPTDVKITGFGEEQYPPLLKEIPQPPIQIYYRGAFGDFDVPHIAVVGTRKATAVGLALAKGIARSLAESGVAVVSGLALGIDAAAHEGALDGGGKTVAVLPVGIDRVYPDQNTFLANRILQNKGLIISEYQPGFPSYKDHFLARNRIVSGLCRGVVVIEAPEKSGALSTAAHALSQNREVFVVPGPANAENYKGSHALIRAGARLVTSAKEILDDLDIQPFAPELPLQNRQGVTLEQKAVLDAINFFGNKPVAIDKIMDFTKMDVSAINKTLALLSVRGVVKEENGKYYL